MTDTTGRSDTADFNQEVRRLWDQKAAFWDERYGEGNEFHKTLIEPSVDRLLGIQPDELVLDVGTGNGAFARWLAAHGARVVAFDFSTVFLERARQRTVANAERIEYLQLDATDEQQLLALGIARFDAAVANMVLMDMASIDTLARCLVKLLKPGGRFVFSIQHPCFNSNAVDIFGEAGIDENGEIAEARGVRVRGYLDVPPGKGAGMPGEPNPHYYFHRPLHELFAPFFDAGFAITGLEERGFDGTEPGLGWGSLIQIPPVLTVRMVVAKR
jgi:2-polyprenyl-3-methyl-5-hydroxy-6-metoxy-1,4-benzoquinol methylase